MSVFGGKWWLARTLALCVLCAHMARSLPSSSTGSTSSTGGQQQSSSSSGVLGVLSSTGGANDASSSSTAVTAVVVSSSTATATVIDAALASATDSVNSLINSAEYWGVWAGVAVGSIVIILFVYVIYKWCTSLARIGAQKGAVRAANGTETTRELSGYTEIVRIIGPAEPTAGYLKPIETQVVHRS